MQYVNANNVSGGVILVCETFFFYFFEKKSFRNSGSGKHVPTPPHILVSLHIEIEETKWKKI